MISSYVRDIGTLPADLVTGWRTAGWRGLKTQFTVRTLHRVLIKLHYLVIEQDLSAVRRFRPPEGVVIEQSDGDRCRLDPILTSHTRESFDARIAAGRTCLFAHRGGRPLGYTWISDRVDPEIEFLPLALPGDAAYMWALFVIRSERGRGIGSALTSARLVAAKELGYRIGWRAVSPANRPSMRTVEKTGADRIVGEVMITKIPGRLYSREVRYGDQPVLVAGS
jgi:GNAT superfamily N-acetyltransferase